MRHLPPYWTPEEEPTLAQAFKHLWRECDWGDRGLIITSGFAITTIIFLPLAGWIWPEFMEWLVDISTIRTRPLLQDLCCCK